MDPLSLSLSAILNVLENVTTAIADCALVLLAGFAIGFLYRNSTADQVAQSVEELLSRNYCLMSCVLQVPQVNFMIC